MSRLVPSPLPEKNCVKIFKRSRIRELSQSLLSKKRIPVASLNLKSQLRQSNCYLQTTVVAQCKQTRHPRRGPQIPLRVKDQGDGSQVIDVVLQGPGVSSYPENTIGSPLYILDCNPVTNPWAEDVRNSHQCCLIVKMPLKADEEQLYLVNDRAAESQQERAGTKRPAGPTSEDEEEEEEEEEEEPKRAPPGKRLRQTKDSVRATEGEVMLSVEVAHPSTEAASDQPEEVGSSVTLPPSLHTTQGESPEVRGSAFNAQQTPRPSHQTRTIACQASLRAAKSKEYHYTKLQDLSIAASNAALKINVFAVVKIFNHPSKSKNGTDFFSSSRLVDETGEAQCTLFCQELERLPKIEKIGDIVRLHRVGVNIYQGSFQIIGRKIFSCLAIDGCPGQPVIPRTSATEFTFTQEDHKRVEELRAWAATQPALNAKERRCVLERVIPGLYFDLVCQVISTCLVAANEYGIVRVWDGTKVAV